MILPYLPIIKQKGRERGRQENSDVFNICIRAAELNTEDKAPTPVRLSSYVNRHFSQRWWVHAMTVPLSCSIHSKVFNSTRCIVLNPNSLLFWHSQESFVTDSAAPTRQSSRQFLCERPLSKQLALSCDRHSPVKGSVCFTACCHGDEHRDESYKCSYAVQIWTMRANINTDY